MMDELVELVNRGQVRDGSVITAQGRVRVIDGDVFIESLHNQVEIEGKNFQELCFGTESQCQEKFSIAQFDKEIETLHAQVKDLTHDLNIKSKDIQDLQLELQSEKESKHVIEHSLASKEQLLEEVTQHLLYARGTLHDKQEEVDKLLKQHELEKQFRTNMQEDHSKITTDLERKLREVQLNLNKANYALEVLKQEQHNNQMQIHDLKNELNAKQKELDLFTKEKKTGKLKKLFKKTKPVPGVL